MVAAMLYIIAIVGIAFLAMGAALKIESALATSYKARTAAAEQANVALDKSCKERVGGLTKQLQDNAAADMKRAAQTAATLAARKKDALAQQAALDKDIAASKDATVLTPDAECAAIRETVGRYARDALGGTK